MKTQRLWLVILDYQKWKILESWQLLVGLQVNSGINLPKDDMPISFKKTLFLSGLKQTESHLTQNDN